MKRSIQLLALTIGTLFSIHSVHAAAKPLPFYQQTLLNERVGFGRNATGGAGGEVYWVTNLNASGPGSLRQACEQDDLKRWIMFAVDGTINLPREDPISVRANKTIDGRGASITLTSEGLWIHGEEARNIIVENLNFANGASFMDGLMIQQGAGDVWVDHCSFSNWSQHNALDVSFPHASIFTDVTISWCKFSNQRLTMVIGGFFGDPNSANIRVTMHHNFFYRAEQRCPRIARALVHAYNNYLYDWNVFGMIVSDYGQLLTEANYLERVNGTTRAVIATDDNPPGFSKEVGNFKFNGAEVEQYYPQYVFAPPYTYQPIEQNWIALKADIINFSSAQRTSGGFANMSTRANVQSGQGNLISSVQITGSGSKKVLMRAIGPSLAPGVPGAMGNPVLRVYNNATGKQIEYNDNWGDNQYAEIQATGLAPSSYLEAAVITTLQAGTPYSAVIDGWGTGIANIEVYDLDASTKMTSKLGNISTRASVDPNNPPIAGFILDSGMKKIIIRGIGPSLGNFGIPNPISDPNLTLHNANGAVVASNNNWQDTQAFAIQQTGFQPSDPREAAILFEFAAGTYTAILRDNYNYWGIGTIEVYKL